MKELSIIIPIYNSELYLERCLKSISLIKHDIDIILIDDGSIDKSGEICDLYANSDVRVRVVHQENKGLVLARMRGISEVETQYFTFVDSDDYLDSEAYDSMLDELYEIKNSSVDIICIGLSEEYMGKTYTRINAFGEGIYEGEDLKKILSRMLSNESFFHFGILPNAVCKIYNTGFVKENPLTINPHVCIGEDADMTYQLLVKAESVLILNRSPYHYCRRNDSMMWNEVDPKSIDYLQKDLEYAFLSIPQLSSNLLRQLNDYICFVTLLCNPQEILDKEPFFESKSDRIALYGAGGMGRALKQGMKNAFSLWVDQNFKIYNCDEIAPVERLFTHEDDYDKVCIAITDIKLCKLIKKSLREKGIKKPIWFFGSNDLDQEMIES